jgi:hypothetical protein
MTAIQDAIRKFRESEEARLLKEEAERKKSFEAKQEKRRLENERLKNIQAEKPIAKTEFQIIGRGCGLIVVAKWDDDKNISEIFVRTNGRSIPLEPCEENFLG